MARSYRTFEERLAQIPEDGRHITYSLKRPAGSNQTGKLAWYAQWEGRDHKMHYVYIGQDKNGIIAARAASKGETSSETPIEDWSYLNLPNVPTNFDYTLVYDEKGQPLYIDKDIDHFFQGLDFTKRIYVRAGSRYVKDHGFHNPLATQAETKEVPLEQFIWTIWNVNPFPRGSQVVHKNKDSDDFRIRNLEVVRSQRSA